MGVEKIKRINLVKARWELGMTQEKVARGLGVTQNTLSAWENGKKVPQRSNRMALARLYGKPIEWLFEGEEEAISYVTADV